MSRTKEELEDIIKKDLETYNESLRVISNLPTDHYEIRIANGDCWGSFCDARGAYEKEIIVDALHSKGHKLLVIRHIRASEIVLKDE